MEAIERIQQKLASLRARDGERQIFGADSHGYQLAPAWTEAQLAAFEAEHGVLLPAGYRTFLGSVGSSGAGPGYGLSVPAPMEMDGFPRVVTRITSKDGTFVEAGTPKRPPFARGSSMARPFPLAEAFEPGLVYDLPALAEGATPYDGCLSLCEHGCGYFDFLVVTGAGAGQVWSDTMAAVRDGGIAPTGYEFLVWYERWLDEGLRSLAH